MIVSCVILNYNDAITTAKLVDSVKNYALLDYVVVVDNHSTDNSLEILKKLENDKVIVISTNKNGGYGYGNNYGFYWAKDKLNSDFVLICNPDVLFDEGIISSAIKVMKENPSVAVVSPIQLNAEGKKANTIAWRVPSALRYILCSGLLLKRIIRSYKYSDSELTGAINYVDCVPGSLLLVNAVSFASIGGYDEQIFLYCEETVLGKKMKDAGYKTVLDGSSYYNHIHSVSINKSIAKEVNRTKLMLKSRSYVIKKYLGGNAFHMALAKLVFTIVIIETHLKAMI